MNSNDQILSEVNELLQHEPTQRHSYFQLKYFLIGKEPTIQSKMWQCLRELKNRKDSLQSMDLEIAETNDKLLLLDINIQKLEHSIKELSAQPVTTMNELSIQEWKINIRQLERQKTAHLESLNQIEERKKWTAEESRFFIETFKSLIKIEDLKHFDDFESQMNYWNEKLTQKINLKMLTSGHIDSELIETVVALPEETPIKKQTLQTLNMEQAQILQQFKEMAQKIDKKESREEN
jgi:hypothetical protein